MFGGCFDDAAVILDGGVNEDSVGVLGDEHVLEICVEERLWQVILGSVLLGKGSVGFNDGYELGVGVLGERGEEAFYVSVDEADYRYPDGLAW